MLKAGIDLVFIPKMQDMLADHTFLQKVFHEGERMPATAEHLAGVYAAKEAFFKAISTDPAWLSIEIKKMPNGEPCLSLAPVFAEQVKKASVSISHDNDYAIAQVILETT
ncbi:holo-ACP synthase [Candidatus Woesearchaeota archaeon]|nr:holo-ACP synthase [Candidatus Woesearchaeota archaeon]